MNASAKSLAKERANKDKALDNALAQIDRSYGKGAVMRLGDQTQAPIEVIPTGAVALDVALGIGGLPRGRVVEIYGPESSGKTTVALHAVANAQSSPSTTLNRNWPVFESTTCLTGPDASAARIRFFNSDPERTIWILGS